MTIPNDFNFLTDQRGYYLGVDPGNTTGFVLTNQDGVTLHHVNAAGTEAVSDFMTSIALSDLKINKIIVEDYKIFKHRAKAHIGSRVPAAQVIGIIEDRARQWGVEVIKQPASILPMAEKLSGHKMSDYGSHAETHWVSALLHVSYYLIDKDLMPTVAQRKAARERAK